MSHKISTPTLRTRYILTLVIFVFLSGCGKEEPQETTDVVRPVKTIVIQSLGMERWREFPGLVNATQKAEMAFRVSGKLSELLVREGDEVQEGQVIGKLDDTDFRIAHDDSQASYKKAQADFKRAKELLPHGHISKADYDKLDAQYKTARANLELAKQNLDYTTLKAAFAGTIAKRYVDNFEQISAKQKIVLLQDTSSLDITFDIPENLMILIDRSKTEKNRQRNIFATFSAIEGKQFPLQFKEATAKADKRTQTYKITFSMTPPEGFNILPGMKTTVIADTSHLERSEQVTLLPVSAVVSDTNKQSTVWLVDEKTMTVHPKAVKAGSMQNDQIEISGLQPGDRVVTAGVPFLRKGMKVSLLETGEQPE